VRALPPLSSLRAFESTARNQSVTRAAEELCRTHGAVSRQLKLLQAHVGAPLFSKEGTGLKLNQNGQALYALVSSVFEQLEHGYARVREQARQSGLHVACSATFAMRWLVPNLADFYRSWPDIRIRLSMTSAREIRTEGADLVIAWDLTSYPESDRERAIRLAPAAFGPVCAPAYRRAAKAGTRIGHDFNSTAWLQWDKQSKERIATGEEITFPHTHLCIEAALSGLGVALVEKRFVRKELEDRQLIAPWGFVELPFGFMALPAAGRMLPEDMSTFIDWIRARLVADSV